MELSQRAKKIVAFLKKYRYVILIFAIGFILMTLPADTGKSINKEQTQKEVTMAKESLEDRLSAVLSNVAGAGEVQVVLTVAAGEEILFQTDNDIANNGDSDNSRLSTVIITDADRCENGLIRQVIPARYQGAIVVCHGADDSSVRLEIVEAVARVTGLGTNRISVLKMK